MSSKQAVLEANDRRPTEADVTRHITRAEMTLHCKRTVWESSEMEVMLKELIKAYDGVRG